MAAECHTRSAFRFQRKLALDFEGGDITSDAGLVLVREFDERLGLTDRLRTLVREARDRRRANAFRLHLHALASNLLLLFRHTVPAGTELRRAIY
jgi:hypothetical protein